MCKQTRTKDHTICDIELGNNPDGCIILITIACYDEIERQERYTILRKLIGLNRDWHIRSGFSVDKFIKTILEENIIA